MTAPAIKTHSVTYHRNGISCYGFYAVAFTRDAYDDDLYLGIVFGDPGDPDTDMGGYTAVLRLEDFQDVHHDHAHTHLYGESGPVSRWRGDDFEAALYAAIRDATAAWDKLQSPAAGDTAEPVPVILTLEQARDVLAPGHRIIDGHVYYSAAWLNDHATEATG
jgi:hypothetical protein